VGLCSLLIKHKSMIGALMSVNNPGMEGAQAAQWQCQQWHLDNTRISPARVWS
jgi:hypothetical protein